MEGQMEDTSLCDRFGQFVPLWDLPPEIRNCIYNFYFTDTYTYYKLIQPLSKSSPQVSLKSENDPREGKRQRTLRTYPCKPAYDPGLALFNVCQTNTALLMTCKQIYTEALPVYQSSRIFSYIQDHKTRFVHIFPYLLNSLCVSFLQSIKHFRISHLPFIYCIDSSFSTDLDPGTILRSDLCEEIRDLLDTSIFPSLTSFMLESEISRHNLCLHYLPTADEIYRQILAEEFQIIGLPMKPATVLKAMKMLSARWPTMQSVTWKFSLFWSVKYIAYGTVHKIERFGWNVSITFIDMFQLALIMMQSFSFGSWTLLTALARGRPTSTMVNSTP